MQVLRYCEEVHKEFDIYMVGADKIPMTWLQFSASDWNDAFMTAGLDLSWRPRGLAWSKIVAETCFCDFSKSIFVRMYVMLIYMLDKIDSKHV